jgi:hypothetical protein
VDIQQPHVIELIALSYVAAHGLSRDGTLAPLGGDRPRSQRSWNVRHHTGVGPRKQEAFMRGLFFVAGLATALLLSAAGASARRHSAPSDIVNIGVVLYTRSDTAGILKARWNYANAYYGPGQATGGPKVGFAGKYHVRYFLESGKFSDEYDLVIKKKGDFYDVSWITDGKVSAVGVGMDVENGLAVGWRRVKD